MVCILRDIMLNVYGVYKDNSYQIYTQYNLDLLFHNVSIASSCRSCGAGK